MASRLLITTPKILSPYASRLVLSSSPWRASVCQRSISTTVVRCDEPKIKRPGDDVSKGVEGAHRRMLVYLTYFCYFVWVACTQTMLLLQVPVTHMLPDNRATLFPLTCMVLECYFIPCMLYVYIFSGPSCLTEIKQLHRRRAQVRRCSSPRRQINFG